MGSHTITKIFVHLGHLYLHRKQVYVWQFHLPRSSMGLAICATSRRPAKELDARLTRPGRMDRWLQMLGENAMNGCGKK